MLETVRFGMAPNFNRTSPVRVVRCLPPTSREYLWLDEYLDCLHATQIYNTLSKLVMEHKEIHVLTCGHHSSIVVMVMNSLPECLGLQFWCHRRSVV
ncbi:hypothetical protein TNCV_16901 [Trichonephila clavipes]|nr:hypothetical protein TNCV_16901 [Trichonephila clavipes]